jgi:hypothetical protein
MDCYRRAAHTSEPSARELNLKTGYKGTGVLIAVADALERRRAKKDKPVTIHNVNVKAGAQAVVGRVEMTPKGLLAKPDYSHQEPEDNDETGE